MARPRHPARPLPTRENRLSDPPHTQQNGLVESFIGRLPFATFYARTTPEILGAVTAISATTGIDQATGMTFIRVFVTVTPPDLAKLGDLDLVSGMPIEGYIATGSR